MKMILLIMLLLSSVQAYSQQGAESTFKGLDYSYERLENELVNANINEALDSSRVISRKALNEIMAQIPASQSREGKILVVAKSFDLKSPKKFEEGDFIVFGFTEKQILKMVDDENGSACSSDHDQGDLGNRWCHAAVVKLIDRTLQSYGLQQVASAALGAAFFLPKEYLIDLHPSMSDLVVADYQVVNNQSTSIDVSAFADGAVFLVLRRRY